MSNQSNSGKEKKTATRKQFLNRIAELGCTLSEGDYDPVSFYIDAPEGYIFNDNGGTLIVDYYYPGQHSKGEAYREILNRLDEGIREMTDEERREYANQ